jgi:hypothetical protein
MSGASLLGILSAGTTSLIKKHNLLACCALSAASIACSLGLAAQATEPATPPTPASLNNTMETYSLGPVGQHATEKPEAPYEIRIYPGADAKFTIYEDDNETYNHEKGQRATYDLIWNDAAKTLTFGARQDSFPGMVATRTLNVVLAAPGKNSGAAETLAAAGGPNAHRHAFIRPFLVAETAACYRLGVSEISPEPNNTGSAAVSVTPHAQTKCVGNKALPVTLFALN